MKTLIALALLAGLCGTHPAGAGHGRPDRDEARAAAIAQERVLGEVIDVDLDDAEDGEPRGPVYEVRMLTPAGDVVTVRISAFGGAISARRAPDLARALRPKSSVGGTP